MENKLDSVIKKEKQKEHLKFVNYGGKTKEGGYGGVGDEINIIKIRNVK